jgi:hypothetical protein
MATESKHGAQGTGKHPHKSTQEPHPHTKEASQHHESEGKASGHRDGHRADQAHAGSKPESARSGGDDLKQREYKDAQGETHHHTKTYMEQHDKK